MYRFKRSIFLENTLILILILGGCTTSSEKLHGYKIPAPARTGERGMILQELIFSLDDTPTPQCHASTIAETSTGLVTAWFGGTREKNPDVGIWVSRRNGDVWTPPLEVANGIQSDTLRYPCWNPVLFQPEGGDLMLFYKVGPDPRNWWGMVMTSIDGGVSWSEPQKLGFGPQGDLIGPVKNKPLQLEDGTILSPSSREFIHPDGSVTWNIHFELSRDKGVIWETIGPIHDGVEIQAIQPSILDHGKGKLQILCRTRQGYVADSWSEDNGQSWDPVQLTTLPNPNSGTDAVTLKNGLHCLVYNHTKRDQGSPGNREMLNVAVSRDGKLWKPIHTLEKQEGEYSYPAVIQTRDGLVHITYTYKRRTIKHVVLKPQDL